MPYMSVNYSKYLSFVLYHVCVCCLLLLVVVVATVFVDIESFGCKACQLVAFG